MKISTPLLLFALILFHISCSDDSQQLLDVINDQVSDSVPDEGDGADGEVMDTDGDGVNDDKEQADGTDPNDNCSLVVDNQTQTPSAAWADADCDSDGVNNADEITDGTDALKSDTDQDGVNDGNEKSDGTDPLLADTDGDGVSDGNEKTDGTNPLNNCSFMIANQTLTPDSAWGTADCDSDGVSNADEIINGTDPLQPDGTTASPIVGTWNLANAVINDGTATTVFQNETFNLSFTATSSDENVQVVFSETPNKVESSGNYTTILSFSFLGTDYTENINSESPFSEGDWRIINNSDLEIIANEVVNGSYEIVELTANSLTLRTDINRVITAGGVDLDTRGSLLLSFTK